MGGWLPAVLLLLPTGVASARQEPMQARAAAAEITAVELLPGSMAGTFAFRIRASRAGDYVGYWVQGRTFVIDLRNARTPFRGSAVGDLSVPQVRAVRASQFLEEELPIARFEVEVGGRMGATARWSGEDLEVFFGPGSPEFQGTGSTSPPGPGRSAQAPDSLTAPGGTPVVPATADSAAAVVPAGPEYRGGIRVDPFKPLLEPDTTPRTNLSTRPMPDARGFTLTGIVYNRENARLSSMTGRDSQGFSYTLHEGDRVQFGFLTSILEREAVFTLDIYGRKQTLRLELPPEER